MVMLDSTFKGHKNECHRSHRFMFRQGRAGFTVMLGMFWRHVYASCGGLVAFLGSSARTNWRTFVSTRVQFVWVLFLYRWCFHCSTQTTSARLHKRPWECLRCWLPQKDRESFATPRKFRRTGCATVARGLWCLLPLRCEDMGRFD